MVIGKALGDMDRWGAPGVSLVPCFLVASRAVQSKLAGPFLPGTWGTELGVLACMGCLATKPMPCPLQRGPPTIG